MKTLLPIITACMLFSTLALAGSPLKLDCRIDTSPNSIPREILLRDGMVESISCNSGSCRDENLDIKMNYNSRRETVLLSIEDKLAGQGTSTQYDNLKKDSKIQFVTYNANTKRMLRITCDVE